MVQVPAHPSSGSNLVLRGTKTKDSHREAGKGGPAWTTLRPVESSLKQKAPQGGSALQGKGGQDPLASLSPQEPAAFALGTLVLSLLQSPPGQPPRVHHTCPAAAPLCLLPLAAEPAEPSPLRPHCRGAMPPQGLATAVHGHPQGCCCNPHLGPDFAGPAVPGNSVTTMLCSAPVALVTAVPCHPWSLDGMTLLSLGHNGCCSLPGPAPCQCHPTPGAWVAVMWPSLSGRLCSSIPGTQVPTTPPALGSEPWGTPLFSEVSW